MVGNQDLSDMVKLSNEQRQEGYRVERNENYVLVFHNNNQVALLILTPDINQKVQDVVERRRKDLKEVEEKTGWKPNS